MIIISPYNQYSELDSDAASYIAAVEAADGQTLESTTKTAINDFVVGCKADGVWDAIKASCILAGARTLAGALTPLVGTAPTNYNFVAGDYNRKTGLKGDGSTKYLDSNRANNADPQNSNHNVLYISEANTKLAILMGDGNISTSGNNRIVYASFFHIDSRNGENDYRSISGSNPTGFTGHSRGLSTEVDAIVNGSVNTYLMGSQIPTSTNVHVFSRENGGIPTDARMSFYSIGESVDLALLDARVTQLMTDINNAF